MGYGGYRGHQRPDVFARIQGAEPQVTAERAPNDPGGPGGIAGRRTSDETHDVAGLEFCRSNRPVLEAIQ
jgi:hypothetical protein